MSENPSTPARRLNWAGWLIVAILYAVGVVAITYAGLVTGLVVGMSLGEDAANKPRQGIGLAPDLSGVVEWVFSVGVSAISGVVLGLLCGLVIMWLLGRFALAPLVRAIPGLRTAGTPGR